MLFGATMFAGVDLGGTTGFAVLDDDGNRVHSTAIKLGKRTPNSLNNLYNVLHTEMVRWGVSAIGYERVYQQHKSRVAACAYGSYEGILWLVVNQLHLPLFHFKPHEIKKIAAGFFQAEKDDMEAAVFTRWHTLVSTHDEADALWIAELTRLVVLDEKAVS